MDSGSNSVPRRPGMPGAASRPIDLIDTFEEKQPELYSIAYRMLGDAAEAEDIVQEVYLRVRRTSARSIEAPHAYLRTVVRRLCLDALTSARATHEQPLDPQLHTALLVESGELPLQSAVRHESIGRALWIVLERLTPQERAVFLLREVFAYSYEEIAALIGLRPANCRQLLHRAQRHLASERVRFTPAPADHARIVRQFHAAARQGNLPVLAAQLVEEAMRWSGGRGGSKARSV